MHLVVELNPCAVIVVVTVGFGVADTDEAEVVAAVEGTVVAQDRMQAVIVARFFLRRAATSHFRG